MRKYVDRYQQVHVEYTGVASRDELAALRKRWIEPWQRIRMRAHWDPLVWLCAQKPDLRPRFLRIKGVAEFAQDQERSWFECQRILDECLAS